MGVGAADGVCKMRRLESTHALVKVDIEAKLKQVLNGPVLPDIGPTRILN